MRIGKLYKTKKLCWMLYPSKEIASAARPAATAANSAAYFSKHFKCNVFHIEPNSIFCLLEKDRIYYKVLSTNGELGWIILTEWCKEDIHEVNQ